MCKQQIFRLGKLPQIIYAAGIFLLPVSSQMGAVLAFLLPAAGR